MEEIINSIKEIKTRGRPRRALWRYNEDGSYNSNPADKDHFKMYMNK